jgi:hypothetical protein
MSAAVLKAAQDVVRVRNALDARRKAKTDPKQIEPGVHWEIDAAIDYLADVLAGCAGGYSVEHMAAIKIAETDDAPKPPPFNPGDIVHFTERVASPPNSDGAKRVRSVRWVNHACGSGYLMDVEDVSTGNRWNGYDSSYFEVRR